MAPAAAPGRLPRRDGEHVHVENMLRSTAGLLPPPRSRGSATRRARQGRADLAWNYVWAITRRRRQKLYHALHGNGTEIPHPVQLPHGDPHRCVQCDVAATLVVAGRSKWERAAHLCAACHGRLQLHDVRRELWSVPPVYDEEREIINDLAYQHAKAWLIEEEEIWGHDVVWMTPRFMRAYMRVHCRSIVHIYEEHLEARGVLLPMVARREYFTAARLSPPPSPPQSPPHSRSPTGETRLPAPRRVRPDGPVLTWSYGWAMTMRARQKLYHALHGNGTAVPQPVQLPHGDAHLCERCADDTPAVLVVAGRSSWEKNAHLCQECHSYLHTHNVRRDLWTVPLVFDDEGEAIDDQAYQHARAWLITEEEVWGLDEEYADMREQYTEIAKRYEAHLMARGVLTPMVMRRGAYSAYVADGELSLPPSPPRSTSPSLSLPADPPRPRRCMLGQSERGVRAKQAWSYTWAITMRARQKLYHALHGNGMRSERGRGPLVGEATGEHLREAGVTASAEQAADLSDGREPHSAQEGGDSFRWHTAWAVTHKEHNRLMRAMHGNGAPAGEIKAAYWNTRGLHVGCGWNDEKGEGSQEAGRAAREKLEFLSAQLEAGRPGLLMLGEVSGNRKQWKHLRKWFACRGYSAQLVVGPGNVNGVVVAAERTQAKLVRVSRIMNRVVGAEVRCVADRVTRAWVYMHGYNKETTKADWDDSGEAQGECFARQAQAAKDWIDAHGGGIMCGDFNRVMCSKWRRSAGGLTADDRRMREMAGWRCRCCGDQDDSRGDMACEPAATEEAEMWTRWDVTKGERRQPTARIDYAMAIGGERGHWRAGLPLPPDAATKGSVAYAVADHAYMTIKRRVQDKAALEVRRGVPFAVGPRGDPELRAEFKSRTAGREEFQEDMVAVAGEAGKEGKAAVGRQVELLVRTAEQARDKVKKDKEERKERSCRKPLKKESPKQRFQGWNARLRAAIALREEGRRPEDVAGTPLQGCKKLVRMMRRQHERREVWNRVVAMCRREVKRRPGVQWAVSAKRKTQRCTSWHRTCRKGKSTPWYACSARGKPCEGRVHPRR